MADLQFRKEEFDAWKEDLKATLERTKEARNKINQEINDDPLTDDTIIKALNEIGTRTNALWTQLSTQFPVFIEKVEAAALTLEKGIDTSKALADTWNKQH